MLELLLILQKFLIMNNISPLQNGIIVNYIYHGNKFQLLLMF